MVYPSTSCMCSQHRSGTPTAPVCWSSSYCNELLTSNSPHVFMRLLESLDNGLLCLNAFT